MAIIRKKAMQQIRKNKRSGIRVSALLKQIRQRCKAVKKYYGWDKKSELKDTNRLLCRDLDEAQRVVEARDERIAALESEFGLLSMERKQE